jgi:hypothetical protein
LKPFKNISGVRYGRLVAVKPIKIQPGGSIWLFRCDCGGTTEAKTNNVKSGNTASCGCLRRESVSAQRTTHGHSKGGKETKTFKAWMRMRERCMNPKTERWPHYGGRGISVCKRWAESFENFLEDMGECPPSYSLDRVDVNGNYEPANCRWATNAQQARNKTTNVWVDHNGERMVRADYLKLRRGAKKRSGERKST